MTVSQHGGEQAESMILEKGMRQCQDLVSLELEGSAHLSTTATSGEIANEAAAAAMTSQSQREAKSPDPQDIICADPELRVTFLRVMAPSERSRGLSSPQTVMFCAEVIA